MSTKRRRRGAEPKPSRSSSPKLPRHEPAILAPAGLVGELDGLAELLHRHGLSEVELQRGEIYVRLVAGGVAAPPVSGSVARFAPATIVAQKLETSTETSDGNISYITSPFVGTFYRAPNPEAAPFVDEGTKIKKGQVICIVEAMKLMNEIESEVDGVIVQMLVENGQPVEYGEPLFKIRQV